MNNLTYPYSLYAAVFCVDSLDGIELPHDFEASVEYVLHAALGERSRQVVRLRFINGLTYDKIGAYFSISRERARQIEHKALRDMRGIRWRDYLRYGVAGVISRRSASAAAEREAELRPQEREAARARFEKALDEALRKTGLQEKLGLDQPRIVYAVKDPTKITIEELDLSVRPYNCLCRAGCRTAEDILKMDKDTLLGIRNMGKHSALEVLQSLKAHGFEVDYTI